MPKLWLIGIVLVVLALAAAAAYVRLAPVPQDRLYAMPGPMEPGEHLSAGAFKAVIPLADLPENAEARLYEIIKATPRTDLTGRAVARPKAFVTRSALWGFPDVTVVWTQDDRLHIHGGLVFGAADLGVNAARIQGWLDQLRAAEDG